MTKFHRSYLGAWGLAFTIVFRVFIQLFMYERFVKNAFYRDRDALTFFDFLSAHEKISMVVLAAELIVYIIIRNRVYNIGWVRIHVWSLLLAFVVLPLIVILLFFMASRVRDPDQYASTVALMSDIRLYGFWGLIAVGHAFFIATIAKSFILKNQTVDESPPGLLDEFAD